MSVPATEPPKAPPAPADPSGRPSKWGLLGLAGLFLLLAGLQVFNVLSRNASSAGRDDVFGALTDPTVPRWVLGSTDPANPRPVAVAFLDGERRRILVRGPHLPTLAAGEVYVLWALDRADDGRTPRSLAAFRGGQPVLDAVVQDAPPIGSLKALAVSVERDPKAKAPTSIVAAGGGP